jgi:putative ABC transport system permease protein
MNDGQQWRRLLRMGFNRRDASEQVDDELRFHTESLVERLVLQGRDEEDARREVMGRFKSYDRTRSALVRQAERNSWGTRVRHLTDSLLHDVRLGLRLFRKKPGFTATVVGTIGLGIGANTAIFCVANGVLLQPLPVSEPSTLVRPHKISPLGSETSVPIPSFVDWRKFNRSFEYLGLNANRRQTLSGGDNPEIIGVRWILGDFFEALGVRPALGRWIESEENWPGAEPTAVLTHSLWQRSFGGDPDVLGRSISLDGESFTVVGIMPESFVFPSATTGAFVPMGLFADQMCWDDRYCSMGSWAIGKLREGVTIESAQADVDRIVRQISEAEGQSVGTVRLESLAHTMVGDVKMQIWVLMGAVGLVLLIACANVASLMLALGENRRREIGVRAALGASRMRISKQFLTESLVLAGAGGLVGIGLGYAAVQMMMPYVSENVPSSVLNNIRLDPTVLIFAVSITTLAGLLFGIAPTLKTSRPNVAGLMGEGARGGVSKDRQRIRSMLVVLEVALTLVLLIGAGLMMQSLRKLEDVDKGFTETNVLTANVFLPARRYSDKDASWGFYRELLERVNALPGAHGAALANTVPLGGASWTWDVWPDGVATETENARSVLYHMVTPSYFEVLGIPMLRGRTFEYGDREGTRRVAIIDETMAEEFWPGENPIGKQITFETVDDTESGEHVYRTVVGVVKSVRHDELGIASRMQVYVPMSQSLHAWSRAMVVAVNTSGSPLDITQQVRQELAALDPQIPLARIETMEGYVRNALSETLVVGGLLSIFSTAALVLAAVGLFGVISYSVAQQFREIGIRLALGGSAGNIVRMVATRGLRLTVLGITLGICGALATTRFMGNILFGVDPVEPVTYAVLAFSLAAVALLATYIPARRATSMDPAMVLREE